MRQRRRYLIERRADPVDPLQLEPRQLVLPVAVKDGLEKEESELMFNASDAACSFKMAALGFCSSVLLFLKTLSAAESVFTPVVLLQLRHSEHAEAPPRLRPQR